MKKLISLLLVIIMCFSLSTAAFAGVYADEGNKYPVIMISGYSSSSLRLFDEETGEEIHAWGNTGDQIMMALEEYKEELIAAAAKFVATGDISPAVEVVGIAFNWLFDNLRCNPDGSSIKELSTYLNTAEETNWANIQKNYPNGEHNEETEMMTILSEEIGAENLYLFTCDFRKGPVEIAGRMRAFIDDVIAHHNEGKAEKDKVDKVNLLAVSHGGQTTGTYLTLYGHEGKVNNAVLTVPALGGASLAYDLMSNNGKLDEYGLLTYIEHGMKWEEDYHILLEAEQLGFVDAIVGELVPQIIGVVQYWQSLWDFIPLEHYEELKAELLDPVESADLIAKSDYMHYEIMSPDGENYYGKGFKKAQDIGTNIYIMAGYNAKSVSGGEVTSDAIIPTAGATGAVVAPFGKRFADGYTQKVDTGYYQVSPCMTVDASTAYIPHHTWFIENYYHGMTISDPFTKNLMFTLLLSSKSFDAHTMAGYPQFHETTNPSHGVHAAFNKSTEGYLSSADKTLVVTNCSAINDITVMSINARGLGLDFIFEPFTLAPGESKEVSFEGEIPEISKKNFEINISFMNKTITPVSDRTFDFTLMNGKAAEYNESEPYVNADMPKELDEVIGEKASSLLKKLGIRNTAATIYNIAVKLIDFVMDFFR
ncbi:MAG: hypothetical protein IJW86_08035 [Clostridia bacterium]|nr:hypothetical protein [Clostridia bacterium]